MGEARASRTGRSGPARPPGWLLEPSVFLQDPTQHVLDLAVQAPEVVGSPPLEGGPDLRIQPQEVRPSFRHRTEPSRVPDARGTGRRIGSPGAGLSIPGGGFRRSLPAASRTRCRQRRAGCSPGPLRYLDDIKMISSVKRVTREPSRDAQPAGCARRRRPGGLLGFPRLRVAPRPGLHGLRCSSSPPGSGGEAEGPAGGRPLGRGPVGRRRTGGYACWCRATGGGAGSGVPRARASSGRDPSRWTSHATGSARAPRRRTCPWSSLSLVTTTTTARAATGRAASSSVRARSALTRPAWRTTIPGRAWTLLGEPGSGCPSRTIDVATVDGTLAWRRASRSRNAPGSALPARAWRRLLPSTSSSFTPCHGSRGRLTGGRPAEGAGGAS